MSYSHCQVSSNIHIYYFCESDILLWMNRNSQNKFHCISANISFKNTQSNSINFDFFSISSNYFLIISFIQIMRFGQIHTSFLLPNSSTVHAGILASLIHCLLFIRFSRTYKMDVSFCLCLSKWKESTLIIRDEALIDPWYGSNMKATLVWNEVSFWSCTNKTWD